MVHKSGAWILIKRTVFYWVGWTVDLLFDKLTSEWLIRQLFYTIGNGKYGHRSKYRTSEEIYVWSTLLSYLDFYGLPLLIKIELDLKLYYMKLFP